jgi:hypothetical protein
MQVPSAEKLFAICQVSVFIREILLLWPRWLRRLLTPPQSRLTLKVAGLLGVEVAFHQFADWPF